MLVVVKFGLQSLGHEDVFYSLQEDCELIYKGRRGKRKTAYRTDKDR